MDAVTTSSSSMALAYHRNLTSKATALVLGAVFLDENESLLNIVSLGELVEMRYVFESVVLLCAIQPVAFAPRCLT